MPSTRFRWTQYVPDLEAGGFGTREFTARVGAYAPASHVMRPMWLAASVAESLWRTLLSRRADICFLQRNLTATLCTWESYLRQPLVFDVDDAIFLGPRGASADRIARGASMTICGNSFLAEHFAACSRVEVLPTAVDTDRFAPAIGAQARQASRPVIGWSGSSSGFPYLYRIEPALRRVLDRHPDAVVKIVADRMPMFRDLPSSRVMFERWQADTEVASLHDFTIGLMPLEDSLWARGKCSFKMLTYMAVGLPVVVSPVGMNVEVLAHGPCGHAAQSMDDWVDAISALIGNPGAAAQMGLTGRGVVETHYARKVIGPKLAGLLRSLL